MLSKKLSVQSVKNKNRKEIIWSIILKQTNTEIKQEQRSLFIFVKYLFKLQNSLEEEHVILTLLPLHIQQRSSYSPQLFLK